MARANTDAALIFFFSGSRSLQMATIGTIKMATSEAAFNELEAAVPTNSLKHVPSIHGCQIFSCGVQRNAMARAMPRNKPTFSNIRMLIQIRKGLLRSCERNMVFICWSRAYLIASMITQ